MCKYILFPYKEGIYWHGLGEEVDAFDCYASSANETSIFCLLTSKMLHSAGMSDRNEFTRRGRESLGGQILIETTLVNGVGKQSAGTNVTRRANLDRVTERFLIYCRHRHQLKFVQPVQLFSNSTGFGPYCHKSRPRKVP